MPGLKTTAANKHPGAWAALGHRLSGLALALFLPFHFAVLGLALEDAARLDSFLALTDDPLVKIAEWGLVVLLALHLSFGLRVLILELLPWRDARKGLILAGAVGALLVGAVFAVRAI